MFDEDNDEANDSGASDSGTKGSKERRKGKKTEGRKGGLIVLSIAYCLLPIAYSMRDWRRPGRIDAE